jgi:hypothetical protein
MTSLQFRFEQLSEMRMLSARQTALEFGQHCGRITFSQRRRVKPQPRRTRLLRI